VTRPIAVDQLVLRKWSVSDLDDATGLLSVAGRLAEPPSLELADCFGSDYDGPAWPPDLEPPVLDGVLITFRVRPADVVRYREALRARIAHANRRYADVVVPRALAVEAALRAREEERRRVIAEAQRLFDLDPALAGGHEAFVDAGDDPGSHGLALRVAERTRF
jgi:hypothetical protein